MPTPNGKQCQMYSMDIVGNIVRYISQCRFHAGLWEKCLSVLQTKKSWASPELPFCFYLVVIMSHVSFFSQAQSQDCSPPKVTRFNSIYLGGEEVVTALTPASYFSFLSLFIFPPVFSLISAIIW